MSKVYAVASDGTEESELLCVVDVLRRAGVDTEIVSISGGEFTSSHGVTIRADKQLGEVNLAACDLLFVPGGMPGSKNLAANGTVVSAIAALLESGKRVAAICAAPALVLGGNGFLKGKKATCFPGFEEHMKGAEAVKDRVITDGQITTAQGLGCALALGLELVRLLVDENTAETIKKKIIY